MDSWQELLKEEGFGEPEVKNRLLENAIATFLHRHGHQLTKIQKEAINPIFAGENALLISNTASGKTEAAVIPVCAKISEDRKNSLCVYVAPTKALLNDLQKRLKASLIISVLISGSVMGIGR